MSDARVRKTGEGHPASGLKYGWRLALGLAIVGLILAFSQPDFVARLRDEAAASLTTENNAAGYDGLRNANASLAQMFSPEVLYWEDDLKRWAEQRALNPNLLATVMQIESCGNPHALSGAGAQGLFQVMPLHFDHGENQMNPEMNAQNGIDHLIDCLRWSNDNVGESFACYNAGPSVIGVPQNRWPAESQYYFRWGTGLYREATQGADQSNTLAEWLAAGGRLLCEDARRVQAQFAP